MGRAFLMEGKMPVEKVRTDLEGVLRGLANAKKAIRKSDLDQRDREIAELRQAVDALKRRVDTFAESATAAVEEIRVALTRLIPLIEALVIEREAQKKKGRWFRG